MIDRNMLRFQQTEVLVRIIEEQDSEIEQLKEELRKEKQKGLKPLLGI